MNTKTLLLLGAKSDIGLAVAHRFAKEGFNIQLAARNSNSLKDECSNIMIRHNVKSTIHELNILDYDSHEKFLNSLPELPTVVLSAIGLLDNRNESVGNINKTVLIIRTNFEGIVILISKIAKKFVKRGSGTIIGISSVAGDRGKSSNYIYGSAKAGLSAFLSGLRNRVYKSNVNVITIKPGYVKTKMTSNMKLPKLLLTNPKTVANYIYSAYQRKKNIVYVTIVWQYIMRIIKLIPEEIFKRLKI